MDTVFVRFEDIQEGERLRSLDPAHVMRLKGSIEELGLQTPITLHAVSAGDDTIYRVSAGAHRLAAMKALGWEGAKCFVIFDDADTAELWEIDENLQRAELSDAQRAEHHVRREAILLRRGQVKDAPQGGRPAKNLDKLSKYSERAAADLGVDERTVRRDLARGKKIAPEVLADVARTDLDKGVVLDELARTPREQQPDKLAEIAARRSTVRPAADPLNDPEAHEKQLAALMSAWNRAAAVVREEFLLRIDTPVFDKGRAA